LSDEEKIFLKEIFDEILDFFSKINKEWTISMLL
jgi:hypothetical protein